MTVLSERPENDKKKQEKEKEKSTPLGVKASKENSQTLHHTLLQSENEFKHAKVAVYKQHILQVLLAIKHQLSYFAGGVSLGIMGTWCSAQIDWHVCLPCLDVQMTHGFWLQDQVKP